MNEHVAQVQLDELWDFGNAIASEQRFRAAVDRAPAGSVAHAELTTQLARALGLQDRFDEADTALAGIADGDPVVRARVLLERGRLQNSAGHPHAAVPLFTDALAAATAAGHDFLAADVAHMLAIADPDDVEMWTARGLEIVAATPDARTKRWAVGLHNNLGWAIFDRGDLDGALAELKLAEYAAREFGTSDQQRWAQEAIDEVVAAQAGRSPVTIRAATPEDVDGLVALKLERPGGPDPELEADWREYRGVLAEWMLRLDDSVICRVADRDGALVGAAWMVLFERVPNADAHRRLTGDIQSVFVFPEHRGDGIGTRLIRALCDEADARGVARVTVSSGSRAVEFYVKAGFESKPSLLERRRPE